MPSPAPSEPALAAVAGTMAAVASRSGTATPSAAGAAASEERARLRTRWLDKPGALRRGGCSAVRWCVVWCGAVRCGAVQCGLVRAVWWCGAVRCCAVRGRVLPVRCDVVRVVVRADVDNEFEVVRTLGAGVYGKVLLVR